MYRDKITLLVCAKTHRSRVFCTSLLIPEIGHQERWQGIYLTPDAQHQMYDYSEKFDMYMHVLLTFVVNGGVKLVLEQVGNESCSKILFC